MSRILDFGCGSGRLLRNLPSRTNAEIWGVDLDAAAIKFCRKSLRFGRYAVSTEYPDGSLPESSFDLIYAFSVLTHLDEMHQDAWLAEWSRILRPGGVLIVTYKNEGLLRKSNYEPEDMERFAAALRRDGIFFLDTGYWRGQFPDFYQGAFHTDGYVAEHWGRFIPVVKQVPFGAFAQCVAVMRKP